MANFLRATLETSAASGRAAARRRAREDVRRPVAAIDAIIADLEELHLAGRKRVPPSLELRLSILDGALPPELPRRWRPRITIAHLMDALFEVQAALLGRNHRADDDAEDAA